MPPVTAKDRRENPENNAELTKDQVNRRENPEDNAERGSDKANRRVFDDFNAEPCTTARNRRENPENNAERGFGRVSDEGCELIMAPAARGHLKQTQ